MTKQAFNKRYTRAGWGSSNFTFYTVPPGKRLTIKVARHGNINYVYLGETYLRGDQIDRNQVHVIPANHSIYGRKVSGGGGSWWSSGPTGYMELTGYLEDEMIFSEEGDIPTPPEPEEEP